MVRFAQPDGEFPDPPTPDYTLAANEPGSGVMHFDMGAGRCEVGFRSGDLVLKPPGVATCFGNTGPHAKCFVALPADLLASLAGENTAPLSRLRGGVF